MKNSIKKKWIAALKSGQYQQGRHSLQPQENTYCCLGVLCNVYAQETGKGKWVSLNEITNFHVGIVSSTQKFYDGIEEYPSETDLTDTIREWAGLDNIDTDTLASLNDGAGGDPLTFNEIADKFIEPFL